MKLALDLDNTITFYPEFFSKLSQLWDDDVYILTFRSDMQSCIDDCRQYNIKYKEIILANKDDDSKAKEIERLGIAAFFDDCPEFLVHVPRDVATFMSRCDANFDYKDKQFLFTQYTGRIQHSDGEHWFRTWYWHLAPDIRSPARIFKIKEVFDAIDLEMTDDAVKAVQEGCLCFEALETAYREYVTHSNELTRAIDRVYTSSIQNVARNILRDGTPWGRQAIKED